MRYYTKERAELNARAADRSNNMITLIGEVSYDLSPAATYVRVLIPRTDGIPMAIKATCSGFDRYLFKKGLVVEVQQSRGDDKRKFVVSRVFAVVKKAITVNCNFRVECESAEDFGRRKYSDKNWKDNPVDRVKFYLNSNYFDHPHLEDVLSRVFNIRPGEFSGAKHRGTGLTFICTTDQFARFLIERNLNGIKNGFMDLGAKLIRGIPKHLDVYRMLADAAGITKDEAKRVSLALCYKGPEDILERVKVGWKADPRTPRDCAREIDVSDR